MKAVVAAFNQEKALVGAFSVITNLRMELFEALAELYLAWALVVTRGNVSDNILLKCSLCVPHSSVRPAGALAGVTA